MANTATFPIDVEVTNLEVNPSYLSGCVRVQADVKDTDVDNLLSNLEEDDIVSYMESQDYTVVKNSALDDILTGMDLDKVIEFVEQQGFKVTEE